MSEFIEIHWTCASMDEARRICRDLVQNRYVACAQIVPWVESIFIWNNQLETAQESKIVMKTRKELFDVVSKQIKEKTTYEVPEILMIEIKEGNADYLSWVGENTDLKLKF